MFCKSCGKKVEILSKYCSSCGKSTKESKILPFLEAAMQKPGKLTSCYRTYITPHHAKIARFFPPIAGVLAAVILVFSIIIPAYGNHMMQSGRNYIYNRRFPEAASALTRAAAVGFSDSELNTLKGYTFLNLGELERARELLQDDSESPSAASLRVLTDVWYQKDMPHYYTETLRELIRLTPNDPHAYFRLAAFYSREGLFENAANVLNALLARGPNPNAQAELYNIYMKSFATNTSLARALSLRPNAMDALSSAQIENLNVGGGQAISLSPSGRYVAIYATHDASRYIDIYEILAAEFRLTATFRLPINYVIDPGMLAWSPDERMIAFFNSAAEKFVSDSSIIIGDISANHVFNLTDPGADFTTYLADGGVFIIDTLPTFSADSQRIYFARRTPKGNWLASIDISGSNLTYHFEPPDGGFVEYKIIERAGRVFFSVIGSGNSPLWGIYVYENNNARRLNFEFDNRLYYLALKDVTVCGRFLLYYLTVASQNNSMLLGVINLETIEPVPVYNQVMDSVDGRVVALKRSNNFGTYHTFITRNATFSQDGRSLFVAEDGGSPYGKLIRRFALEGSAVGVGSFVYASFEADGAYNFCVPNGVTNASGTWFRQVSEREFLIYDDGFRLLRM